MFGRKAQQNNHNFHPTRGVRTPHYMKWHPGGDYYFAEAQRNMMANVPSQFPANPYPIHPGFPPTGYFPTGQSYGSMQNEPIFEQTYPIDWLLQNPLEPKKYQGGGNHNPYWSNSQPYLHPYPKHSMTNRPPSGINSIMNSFKAQDGSLDFNKMVNTAGQMVNAFSQVSGLVKGLGGFFKL